MDEVDAGGQVDPGREQPPADLHRLGQAAQHQRQDRPQPQRLLADGVDVVVVAVAQAVQHAGRADRALDGPGQRGRRGLVPGDEQRHQLVAQLLVGHLAAVLVAGLEQQREDVVAFLEVGRAAALADLGVDQLVGGPADALEDVRAVDAVRAEHRHHRQAARVRAPFERVRERRAQALAPGVVLHAEDRPDDHLERDALHRGAHRVGLPGRPALDLRGRDLGHRLLVAAHALAVEGRQHQLALRHVGALVQQQHRVVPEHRQQHDVRLAGVQHARVAGEDLLDRVGVGEEHPRALVRDPQREHVAVAAPAVLEHRPRPEDPARRLERARRCRAGWDRGVHIPDGI